MLPGGERPGSDQREPRMTEQTLPRGKCGSLSATTFGLAVPKVVTALCPMPPGVCGNAATTAFRGLDTRHNHAQGVHLNARRDGRAARLDASGWERSVTATWSSSANSFSCRLSRIWCPKALIWRSGSDSRASRRSHHGSGFEAPIQSVAAPAYIARFGNQEHPSDVDGHRYLQFLDPHTGRPFEWDLSVAHSVSTEWRAAGRF